MKPNLNSTTAGSLLGEFGPERMFDTPMSEGAIVGIGIGAAASVFVQVWGR